MPLPHSGCATERGSVFCIGPSNTSSRLRRGHGTRSAAPGPVSPVSPAGDARDGEALRGEARDPGSWNDRWHVLVL